MGDGEHESSIGAASQDQKELDAGARFVLKSKGSWLHCGYHLTTSIVAPPLLSLPYAFAFLGWSIGLVCLVIGALVTFYSYNLISLAIYLLLKPEGSLKLYEFVMVFGCLMLVLAQVPSFHSLRHINLVSLVLCLCYSACATAGSIYVGYSSKGPEKDYSVLGDTEDRIFGMFNAIAIIATSYGNGIIPEIQATLAPPVKGKMFKGLCVCYTIVALTFFSVAISGYWAFGNQSDGLILSNFVVDGRPLMPKWFILMTNMFTILQLSAVGVVYCQPTNEVLERAFSDPHRAEFSLRNVIPRVISRSISVIAAITIAAMLPFFGDINSLIGAFGFMPLDFVLPVVFFNLTFKPSKRSAIFWLNITIAVVFSALGVVAAVAAVRQIVLDAKTYRLFANV
ncbi:hypothetical protein SAY86_002740 [Trapa natans]|uniref:Amino acid transporter transmembrane domain-containing protein n=1 Tax=Trapa natans TaxID=22666 RepID=A0AAN7LU98_TRANT|nr:hypothetical protein SAY86_002740 [Trapa natans]